jgi:hypothetical protein
VLLVLLLLRLKKQTNVKKAFGDLMTSRCQKKDSECWFIWYYKMFNSCFAGAHGLMTCWKNYQSRKIWNFALFFRVDCNVAVQVLIVKDFTAKKFALNRQIVLKTEDFKKIIFLLPYVTIIVVISSWQIELKPIVLLLVWCCKEGKYII